MIMAQTTTPGTGTTTPGTGTTTPGTGTTTPGTGTTTPGTGTTAPGTGTTQNFLTTLSGTYSFYMRPATSLASSSGTSNISLAGRQDVFRVGWMRFDANGNITGRMIANNDNNMGQTWLVTANFTGRYTVSSDGTGFFSIDQVSGQQCTDMTLSGTGQTPHPNTSGGTPLAGNTTCPTGSEALQQRQDFAFVFSSPGATDGKITFFEISNVGSGAHIFLWGEASRWTSATFGTGTGGGAGTTTPGTGTTTPGTGTTTPGTGTTTPGTGTTTPGTGTTSPGTGTGSGGPGSLLP
jgi:hypothetical protein